MDWTIPTIVMTSMVLFVLYYQKNKKRKLLPPTPPAWPIVGHSIDFVLGFTRKVDSFVHFQPNYIGNVLVDLFTRYRNQCGGMYRIIPFIGFECVVVSDASSIKQVLGKKLYQKSQAAYSTFKPILGGGLVTLEGSTWKLHRALINPLFRFESLQNIAFRIFQHNINDVMREISKNITEAEARGERYKVDVMDVFRRLTLKIIAETTLGIREESATIQKLMRIYTQVISEINLRVWHPHRAYIPTKSKQVYEANLQELDSMILALIQQKRSSNDKPTDLLSLMLTSFTENGKSLSNAEILAEVKTFLLAGHETSSMWLAYFFHCTSQSNARAIQAKILHEAMENTTPCNEYRTWTTVDYASLGNIEYITNALKETLRLYPIVPLIVKTATEEDKINEYNIPKGCNVAIDIWGAHHDPVHWGNNVHEFHPERFDANAKRHHNFSYLPFALGNRNCLGQNFAYMEAKLVVLMFSRQFVLIPERDGFLPTNPFDIPMHPKDGIPMFITHRA